VVSIGDDPIRFMFSIDTALLDEFLPSIQLSSETTILGFARKEFWHDLFLKQLSITDDKALAVRQPTNGIMILFI
jgi:hypothetical protein